LLSPTALVGTRTNQNGTDSWTLLPAEVRYVHLDIAAEEVRRNYESNRLVGDVRIATGAPAHAKRWLRKSAPQWTDGSGTPRRSAPGIAHQSALSA